MSIPNRYQRQVILKGFGQQGQDRLRAARVLVIGAGGLGCPVLQYLAAAGVGTIGIADHDVVDATNLHRQVLFNEGDIGMSKAEVAAEKLKAMNAGISCQVFASQVSQENVLALMQGYDVIVDCTDNFPSRYMINDACVLRGLPLVWAAVSGFEGQVAVFNLDGSGQYRDLFPDMPAEGEVAGCAESGVLGVLPGIIGSLQAMEVIKVITQIGAPLVNQLLTYRALDNRFLTVNYKPHINDPLTEDGFISRSYEQVCLPAPTAKPLPADKLGAMMQSHNAVLIDVRDLHEKPDINGFEHERVPMYALDEKLTELSGMKAIFICQTGARSIQAAILAADQGIEAFYITGGIKSMQSI